jgi:Holliday junction resolvase RusA-like endonuclease
MPANVRIAQALLLAIMGKHKPETPLHGILSVELDIHYPHTVKSGGGFNELRLGRVPKISKPDVDNIAKLILDAMVKGGIIDDDAHVHRLNVAKWHSDITGIGVIVEELKLDYETANLDIAKPC